MWRRQVRPQLPASGCSRFPQIKRRGMALFCADMRSLLLVGFACPEFGPASPCDGFLRELQRIRLVKAYSQSLRLANRVGTSGPTARVWKFATVPPMEAFRPFSRLAFWTYRSESAALRNSSIAVPGVYADTPQLRPSRYSRCSLLFHLSSNWQSLSTATPAWTKSVSGIMTRNSSPP